MVNKAYTPNTIDEHIGQRMQLRRIMMGMSQKDLAKLCGVTFQQVQKYETAGNRIAASRLFELSAALQTPISFFFAGLPGYIEREPRNGRLPKWNVGEPNPNDPLANVETLQMINLYWKLPESQREMVYNLIKMLSDKK